MEVIQYQYTSVNAIPREGNQNEDTGYKEK